MGLVIVHYLLLTTLKMALILREGPTFGINGNFGASEKKLVLISVKLYWTKFCLNLHYNANNVTYLKIYKFKSSIKNSNIPAWFVLEAYLMNLTVMI